MKDDPLPSLAVLWVVSVRERHKKIIIVILGNGQTYFKILAVFTLLNFLSMFSHFSTFFMEGLIYFASEALFHPILIGFSDYTHLCPKDIKSCDVKDNGICFCGICFFITGNFINFIRFLLFQRTQVLEKWCF